MRIFSRAHVSLAAPSFVLVGRVGIMAPRQFKVALGLELGYEFDFDFPSSGNFMLFLRNTNIIKKYMTTFQLEQSNSPLHGASTV